MVLSRIYREIRKLLTTVRQNGIRDTVWRISLGLFQINQFLVVEKDLINDEGPYAEGRVPMEVRRGTLSELKALRERTPGLPTEFYMDEIDGVDTFWLAFINGEIAGIGWIYFKGHPNRFINLRDKEVELSYFYTLEQHRGKNVLPKIEGEMFKWLKERGYEVAVGFIHARTIYNIRASQKGGMKIVGKFTQVGPFRPKYAGSRKGFLFRRARQSAGSC